MLFKYKSLVAAGAAALFALVAALPVSAQFQLKRDYNVLDKPQSVSDDGKIEVLEFFAYGCPHCGVLEPVLAEWIKKQAPDIIVKRVPAALPGFNLRGIDNAPLYYTLEAMGKIDKLHDKIFDAANKDGVILASITDQTKWLAKQGVDAAAFEATRKSFTVDAKSKGAAKLAETYRISSTPTMVVGGKYTASQTQGPAHLLSVIDFLIAEVRASMKKPATKAAVTPSASAVGAASGAAAVAAKAPPAAKDKPKTDASNTKADAAAVSKIKP